jgi:hypothetical protein
MVKMKNFSYALCTAAICVATTCVRADSLPPPTIIDQCPKGYEPGYVDISLEISTSIDCPILEDEYLRKLVDKFGVGSVFAYPAILGTCVSGSDLQGTLTLNGQDISIVGSSESAQRLFAEAGALDMDNPLFIDGGSFISGAAMTIVSLQAADNSFNLDLVLADRFTIDFSGFPSTGTSTDTEDFLVVGSKGDYKATGRLTGSGDIYADPGAPLQNETLMVTGILCLK